MGAAGSRPAQRLNFGLVGRRRLAIARLDGVFFGTRGQLQSGFGESPVVWRTQEALKSNRFMWPPIYQKASVYGWRSLSIIGSLASLPPDVARVRRLSVWLRLRVPADYTEEAPSKVFAVWACYFWTAACAPVAVTNWYRFTHFVLGSFIVGLAVFALNLFHSDEKGHPIVGFFLVSLAALLLRLCLWGLHVL